MKNSHQCPKCQSRRLICVDPYRTYERAGVGNPGNPLHVVNAQRSGEGWSTDYGNVGSIAAWICSACGYTELWSHSFQALQPDPGRGVHLVDASGPPQGPYR